MSDLDNEEYEATKRINLVEKVKECAKNTTREDIIEVVEKLGIEKEKSADEMLEELGYKKDKYYSSEVLIRYWGKYIIDFDLYEQKVSKCTDWEESVGFTMQELNIINKKCKELGWL